MTIPLSPAAQAVFSAWQGASDGHYSDGEWIPNVSGQLAAALRAAVEQAVPEPPDCGTPANDYVRGLEDRQRMVRFRLLSIADELDPPNA